MANDDYKATWNGLSATLSGALLHVAGHEDEDEFAKSALRTLGYLEDTTGVRPADTVLEIGCGVGRVGQILAPRVREWIGCDVSGNMLTHARQRLAGRPNVRLQEIDGVSLAPIPDASVDLVYSTVVFMHLVEWDRWNYVREAFRVLRPGGRLWVDNVNLCTDDGWALFAHIAANHPPSNRPFHLTRASTPQELETYFRRAGFGDVHNRSRHLWVDVWGLKPAR
jgi:SAM-dependent methyltransferase